MVSVKSSPRRTGRRKLGFVVGALAAPLTLSLACGKLIGVEDTTVMTGGASSQGGSGGSSATSGGAATTTGGVSSPAGGSSATGGTSASTGGKASSGGTTSAGGTTSVPEGGDATVGGAGEGPGGAPTVTGGTSSGGATAGKGGTSAGGTSTGGAGGKGGTGGAGGKGGTGGASGGTGTGGASTTCTPACPLDKPVCEAGVCVNRGPTMVKLGTYYIDSTEVTVAQYQKFLDAKGTNTSGQPAVCSWNTTYYDDSIPMYPDNYPMSSVDWCDATAFCSWAGKRLCGNSKGGPIARADMFTPNLSQWYLACGGPNSGTHPSGTSMCNNSGSIAAVGTYKCEGFYPGLFDLEGNVAEWVDSCAGSTGKDDICYLMGGGIFDMKSYCDEVYEGTNGNKRSATAVSFGFRCCSG